MELKLFNRQSDVDTNAVELTADELESVTGGAERGETLCSCGRGKIFKDGMCKHCYQLLASK